MNQYDGNKALNQGQTLVTESHQVNFLYNHFLIIGPKNNPISAWSSYAIVFRQKQSEVYRHNSCESKNVSKNTSKDDLTASCKTPLWLLNKNLGSTHRVTFGNIFQ